MNTAQTAAKVPGPLQTLLVGAILATGLFALPRVALAASPQVDVQIGGPRYAVEPVCDYGYYDYAPYACAPLGFWGPEFFWGGHFRGAGPWAGRGRHYNKGPGERQFRTVHTDGRYTRDRQRPMDREGHR
jgi:hypothetical protein